jgi:hypothetical protein
VSGDPVAQAVERLERRKMMAWAFGLQQRDADDISTVLTALREARGVRVLPMTATEVLAAEQMKERFYNLLEMEKRAERAEARVKVLANEVRAWREHGICARPHNTLCPICERARAATDAALALEGE